MRLKVTVTDLRDCFSCPRRLWLRRKTRIERVQGLFSAGRRFHHILHSTIDLLSRALKADLPAELVGTDVFVNRKALGTDIYLCGKIDVLRKTKEGYIIQENKSSNPPKDRRIRPGDKLQLDAYAFLIEGDERYRNTPIKSGVILYNDLTPREVKLEPSNVEGVLEKVKRTLDCKKLPEAKPNTNCGFCYYYPLCQVLPKKGGLTVNQIKELPHILEHFLLTQDARISLA